jgi:hypothetical protein
VPTCAAEAPNAIAASTPFASAIAARGDYRSLDHPDNLLNQRECSNLRAQIVGQEHAAMAASLISLRDDRIDAVGLEKSRFVERRR